MRAGRVRSWGSLDPRHAECGPFSSRCSRISRIAHSAAKPAGPARMRSGAGEHGAAVCNLGPLTQVETLAIGGDRSSPDPVTAIATRGDIAALGFKKGDSIDAPPCEDPAVAARASGRPLSS